MKNFLFAFKAFAAVLKADSYCLITTRGNAFTCTGDIKPTDFYNVVNEVWDNIEGPEDTLKKYKELLENTEHQ